MGPTSPTVAALLLGPKLYALMGGRDGSLAAAVTYSAIVFAGAIPLWLFNSFAAIIHVRAATNYGEFIDARGSFASRRWRKQEAFRTTIERYCTLSSELHVNRRERFPRFRFSSFRAHMQRREFITDLRKVSSP